MLWILRFFLFRPLSIEVAFLKIFGLVQLRVLIRVKEQPTLMEENQAYGIRLLNNIQEDVALMKEIGLDSFRFSISWSRILPRGRIAGGVNQAGINFYNHLINELISNGIRPLVTLFHWDTPQALEDEYGGFLNPQIVNDFLEYVDICFKEFGDRVKEWITINEPNMFAVLGYNVGHIAPGRCSSYVQNCTVGNSATEPYLVAHYLILSHAAAVQLYRKKYQSFHGGTIGMTIQTYWMIPKYNTPACREAAERALDFFFGWFADPITYGDYPKTMRELVGNRLPKFTKKQSKMVRGSFDFFGLNYYTSRYVEDVMFYANTNLSYTTDSRVNQTTEKNGVPLGEPECLATMTNHYPSTKLSMTRKRSNITNSISLLF